MLDVLISLILRGLPCWFRSYRLYFFRRRVGEQPSEELQIITIQLYKHHARARASRRPPAAGAGLCSRKQFVHKYLHTYIDRSTYDVCTIHILLIFTLSIYLYGRQWYRRYIDTYSCTIVKEENSGYLDET